MSSADEVSEEGAGLAALVELPKKGQENFSMLDGVEYVICDEKCLVAMVCFALTLHWKSFAEYSNTLGFRKQKLSKRETKIRFCPKNL